MNDEEDISLADADSDGANDIGFGDDVGWELLDGGLMQLLVEYGLDTEVRVRHAS